jgi:ABC-type transport system substrate-binding protein
MSEVFRVGLVNRWEHFDPRRSTNFANFTVQWHLYEPVFRASEQPNQLDSVLLEYPLQQEGSEDGSAVYSARVKPGVCFSDGTPVTPAHIAASLDRTPSFLIQASARARGNQVFFKVRRPNARFELVLSRHEHSIVLEKGNQFLGTGPYIIAPDSQPDRLHLTRNPYYKGSIRLPEIECVVYPVDSNGSRRKLLEAVDRGEVDFTDELPRDDLNRVQRMRKCIDLGYCTAILFFNTERQIFLNPVVRRAFAEAIDRKALAAQSYSNALAFTATGLLPPSLGQSAPDGIGYDLEHARQTLAEAGVKPPITPLIIGVVPVPRPHLPDPRATAEMIASQLGKLGFNFDIRQARTMEEYYEMCGRGQYDLMLSGWIPDTADPLDYMESLLATHSVPAAGQAAGKGSNLSRWRNETADRAIDKERVRQDPENWRQLSELLQKEVPLLPLMYGPRSVVVTWRAKNFPRNFGYRPFLAELDLEPRSELVDAAVT